MVSAGHRERRDVFVDQTRSATTRPDRAAREHPFTTSRDQPVGTMRGRAIHHRSRCSTGPMLTHQPHCDAAELYDVAVVNAVCSGDFLIVNKGSIGTVEIVEQPAVAGSLQLGMFGG